MAKALSEAQGAGQVQPGGAAGSNKYKFNMEDADEDAGFAALPAGVYDCKIFDCKFKISKSKGNPMWEVIFETVEKHDNRHARFWTYVVWTEEQLGRAKRFMNRVAPEMITGKAGREFNPENRTTYESMIGELAKVRVTVERYEGENRNRVKDVMPASSGTDFLSS